METIITVDEFNEKIKGYTIFSIYDLDLDDGSGEAVDKKKLQQSLKICKVIKFYDDFMIKIYDVYYDKSHIHKMIRVLLR